MKGLFKVVVVLFVAVGGMYLLGSVAILSGLRTSVELPASSYQRAVDASEGFGC